MDWSTIYPNARDLLHHKNHQRAMNAAISCQRWRYGAQSGAVLVVSLVLLLVMSIISIYGIRGALLEEKMASSFYGRNLAFQSAEAALAEAIDRIEEFKCQYDENGCQFTVGNANGKWENVSFRDSLSGTPQYKIVLHNTYTVYYNNGNQIERSCWGRFLVMSRSDPTKNDIGRSLLKSIYDRACVMQNTSHDAS